MEYGWATTAASKLMQTQGHEFLRAVSLLEGHFVRRGLKMGPSHLVKKDLARSKAPSSRLWGGGVLCGEQHGGFPKQGTLI